MSLKSPPRIAIIGGGPAGLTLGLLLHRRGIPFTIFELREKPTEAELAKPSGMLDLHEESGLAAIRECGLLEQFNQLTGECSEAQKVADLDGTILYTDEGELSERPEISRHALTRLLSSQLPDGTIKWGHKLLSASSSSTLSLNTGPNHKVETELDFGPHGKRVFDLVIGADGAWSRVRSLLTDEKPHYAGRQTITLNIRHITTKYPHLAELVGPGSFAALGLHHGVMSQRGPQDSARIYIFLTTADENFAVSSGMAGQPAAAAVVKDKLVNSETLLGRCGPVIKELVTVACNEEAIDNPGGCVDIKPLYTLSIGTSWRHKTGTTLIGDAAHLMCPFAGEGVNLAMWDSLLLAHAIFKAYEATTSTTGGAAGEDAVSFQKALDPLIEEFEVEMVARTKEKAEETYQNGEMLFGDDAAVAFTKFFEAAYNGMHA